MPISVYGDKYICVELMPDFREHGFEVLRSNGEKVLETPVHLLVKGNYAVRVSVDRRDCGEHFRISKNVGGSLAGGSLGMTVHSQFPFEETKKTGAGLCRLSSVFCGPRRRSK